MTGPQRWRRPDAEREVTGGELMGESPERHLSADEVAAYVDGALAGDERARIEAHLAVCADCRAEVREVTGLVRSLPEARRSARRVWIPAAAAAAVLVAGVPFSAGAPVAPPPRRPA